jgi:hypothetical protein
MLNLKLGKAQLSIRFGYEATVRSKLLKKMAAMAVEREGEETFDRMDAMMEIVPEMILVGAQKFHSKEYGYDYKTEAGKEEAMSKIYALLDDYFEEEDADFSDLMESLQAELMENGFLAKMFKKEVKDQEEAAKKEKAEK